MDVPLVKGSPYISAQFLSPARPLLRAPRAGSGGANIASVVQAAPGKLHITVGQVPRTGSNTWLLWASGPIAFTFAGGSVAIRDAGAPADGTFTGTLRMAWLPSGASAAAVEAMLDAHVNVVPLGGDVTAWANAAAGVGSYRLSYTTTLMSPGSSGGAPLLLALPHHIDTLAQPATGASFPLGVAPAGSPVSAVNGSTAYTSRLPAGSSRASALYGAYAQSVRGPLVPVAAPCWLLQEQLMPLTSETQAAANLRSPTMRANIEQTLLVRCWAWAAQHWHCIALRHFCRLMQ